MIALFAVVLLCAVPVTGAWAQAPAPTPAPPATPSAASLFTLQTAPTTTTESGAAADAPLQILSNMFMGIGTGGSQIDFLQNTACNQGGYTTGGITCSSSSVLNTANSPTYGLQQVMSYYSYGMLVLASFLLLYYLVRIVAETAHTGKPGGRANQLWGPIRTVLAIGLLIPMSNGLNSGQMVIINIASEGSVLASNAWSVFIGQMANNNTTTVPMIPDQAQAVKNMIMIYTCMDVYNAYMQYANGVISPNYTVAPVQAISVSQALDSPDPSNTAITTAPLGFSVWLYGNQIDSSFCGTVSYQSGGGATDTSPLGVAITNDVIPAMGKAEQAMETSVSSFVSGTSNIVSCYSQSNTCASGKLAIDNSVIQGIVTTYNKALIAIAQAATKDAASEITSAGNTALLNSYGWLSAGSMYMGITKAESLLTAMSQDVPQITPPNIATLNRLGSNPTQGWFGNTFANDGSVQADQAALDVVTAITQVGYKIHYGNGTGGLPAGSGTPSVDSSDPGSQTGNANLVTNAIGSAVNSSFGSGEGAMQWLGAELGIQNGFPLAVLQGEGSWLLDIAFGLFTVAAAVGAAASFEFFGTGIGGSLGAGLPIIMSGLGYSVLIPGIMLFYVLPMLPFVRFLFAIFGWILQFAEAVISIPIFALAHLDPDGEGVLPQATRGGYILLLQLFFRPIMIIAGLILSMLLIYIMVGLLNALFAATLLGNNGGSSSWFFSQIIYVILHGTFAYGICNLSLKAMDHVPNSAMRWIGGQGDHHQSHGHHEAGTIAAVSAAQQTSNMIGQGLSRMGQHRQSQIDKQKAAEWAKDENNPEVQRHNELKNLLQNQEGQDTDNSTGITQGPSNNQVPAGGPNDRNSYPGPSALSPRIAPANPSEKL